MGKSFMQATAPRQSSTTLQTAWHFVKQELLYLSWALMETAVIAPIALLAMPWARFWPASQMTLFVLLLILAAFNLVRLMSALAVKKSRQRLIIGAALLATVLLAWRMMLFAPRPLWNVSWLWEALLSIGNPTNAQWSQNLMLFLVVVISFWRGVRLAPLKPDVEQVGLRLRLGAIFLGFIALAALGERPYWSPVFFVLLYYLAGLTAVSLVRAEQIERENSGMSASVSPKWVGAVFATSLLVVTIAGLLAALLSGQTTSRLAGWLDPLWNALLLGTGVVLSTLAYLLSPALFVISLLIEALAWLLNRILTGVVESIGESINPEFFSSQPTPAPTAETVLESVESPQSLISILFMLALVLLVVFGLSRLYQQATVAPRQSDFNRQSGRQQVSRPNLGQRLLKRFGLLRNWRTATTIRRIYQHMCAAADGAGYPRREAETPYEYLTKLTQVWPENSSESRIITEAFIKVRYGEVPESKEEFENIKSAWQKLENTPPVEVIK